MLLTADFIYHPEGWRRNHLLEVSPEGRIVALRPMAAGEQPESYPGLLCPGWVNAHCHLELSALAGKVPPGLGMADFITQVAPNRRQIEAGERLEAAETAMRQLYASGTVAVGDICNSPLTADLKRAMPKLYTFSFLEAFGLAPNQAEARLAAVRELTQAFEGLPHSPTLHAPYSVSPQLRDGLYRLKPGRQSIHLLESQVERQLLAGKKGSLYEQFCAWGFDPGFFPRGSSIRYVLENWPGGPVLWVHNTEMTPEEAGQLRRVVPESWFCFCPRSNQYIHGRLPDPALVPLLDDRLCLGTDSAASNYSLDVWDEVRYLHEQWPDLSLHQLLRWATTQGAAALGASDFLGTFAAGTQPGVLWVDQLQGASPRLTAASQVKKLF